MLCRAPFAESFDVRPFAKTFGLRSPTLVVHPPASGRPAWFGGFTRRRISSQGSIEERLEPTTGDLAVPPLRSLVVGHDSEQPVAEAGPELVGQPSPLGLIEGSRCRHVETQLRPRMGTIGMLTTRTAGWTEHPSQLPSGNDMPTLEPKILVRFRHHGK